MSAPTLVGLLLVIGPVVGAGGVASLPWRAWAVPREEHLRIVASHPVAWTLTNGGFLVATVSTAAGLAALPFVLDAEPVRTAWLVAEAVSYVIVGTLWCAVLAIRQRTTPAIAELVAAGKSTEPAESLLGALNGGLFAAFILGGGATIIALGATLALGGGVAAPVAWLVAIVAVAPIAMFAATGDAIPALLYVPTTLLGVALFVGWT